MAYRYHGDLDKLLSIFSQHAGFLIKSAAYTLGYLDGLHHQSFDEIAPDAAKQLSGSYFEPIWNSMHEALRAMARQYPQDWKDLNIYDELTLTVEKFYSIMGLTLSTSANGLAHVAIPFTRETTPPEMLLG